MHVKYDSAVDAAYVYLVDAIGPGSAMRQELVDGGSIVLDYDADDRLLGIEVLQASRRLLQETLDEASTG